MKSISALLSLLPAVFAVSSAPAGCITVAKSGGNYATIQAAVNSLSTTSTAAQCIFIKAGTYNEQVLVSARNAQLTIYGATTTESTYKSNTVTISSGLSQANGLSNDATATLRVKAKGFRLYNVDVENTYGQGSQAVALSAYADSGYYGSSFIGFQDTVLSNVGSQIYVACKIEGATDFIFGQQAFSWFERVDLRVLGAKLGYVTADGPTTAGASYYVFNKCDIAAADGETVPAGAYYLGRPWREFAKVVFQYTSMSSVINSAGWSIWATGDTRTSSVLFGEYKNTGTGASGTRATFSTKLSSPILIKDILGSSYASQPYFDSDYFNGA